ncbi:MAG TPA: hypothetical protein VNQ74_06980, partial [Burkholderiaceae bacterium]|nr:hypothetical protein [Burkholderiaceae bacterium]
VFGQYESAFVPLLPQVLKGLGFRGALHTAFDGGQLPRADQRKTNWGPDSAHSIEALSATPLDASRPETWLKFAERVADTIARDHVATIVLAGWPGTESEYFDDLRGAARFGTVLGKLVTLDEYFRVTREVDDWTKFNPRQYLSRAGSGNDANTMSSQVEAYRSGVRSIHRQLGEGLAAVAGLKTSDDVQNTSNTLVAINAWNSPSTQFVGIDPLNFDNQPVASGGGQSKSFLPDVLGCGYAALTPPVATPLVALAEDRTLRNERVELTVSNKTGGIQSLRTHRDRGTRVSQRLVFHDETGAAQDLQMVADRVEISRNDEWIGEITSTGRLLGAKNKVLARFTQR